MKFTIFFAWYDFWVGGFWDREKRILYICPLPTLVLKFDWTQQEDKDE